MLLDPSPGQIDPWALRFVRPSPTIFLGHRVQEMLLRHAVHNKDIAVEKGELYFGY